MFSTDDVRALLDLSEPVLSIYLNVDHANRENQAVIAAWRIWLKDTLKAKADWLAEVNDPHWHELSEKVEAFLSGYEPDGKALALFVSYDDVRSFALPFPVENSLHYGAAVTMPLVWMIDEYEPYMIVLVDQEKANILRGHLGSVTREDRLELDIDDYDWHQRSEYQLGTFAQGDFRDLFEKMIDEHRARYYRELAARIEMISREQGIERIIFGGADESAHMVKNFLPDRMQPMIVGVLPIPMRANGQEILAKAGSAAQAYERSHEVRLVDEVIDMAKSNGRGALGREAVMKALEEQRVELLILPYPVDDDTFAAELQRKLLKSSGTLELVYGAAADRLREEGGIGARLYYAIPSAGNVVGSTEEKQHGRA